MAGPALGVGRSTALLIAVVMDWPHPHWTAITVVVLMAPNLSSAAALFPLRIAGVAMGAILGFLTVGVWGQDRTSFLLACSMVTYFAWAPLGLGPEIMLLSVFPVLLLFALIQSYGPPYALFGIFGSVIFLIALGITQNQGFDPAKFFGKKHWTNNWRGGNGICSAHPLAFAGRESAEPGPFFRTRYLLSMPAVNRNCERNSREPGGIEQWRR